jgi:hypothetical protein
MIPNWSNLMSMVVISRILLSLFAALGFGMAIYQLSLGQGKDRKVLAIYSGITLESILLLICAITT